MKVARRLRVSEALELLLGAVAPRVESDANIEEIATEEALGRVLASDQISPIDVPPMDNSQMDGYAVRASDTASAGARLRVAQRIPAGTVGVPLGACEAARIFTGAMIPEGADAVVMQEQCSLEQGADGDFVTVGHAPEAGQWIRRTGEDIGKGSTIREAGTRLRAQELGLAASVGLARLEVSRRPQVAVFFTGDELALPGETAPESLKPGAIYNSNRYLLRGLLQGLGCEITDLGIVPDSLDATRAALRRAAQGHDFIITSGGVSVGEEDHVKAAVEAEGSLDLWQIAMKPGKPLAFGSIKDNARDVLFLGLPGNPVSGLVTFVLFARPVLLRLQGMHDVAPLRYRMRADFAWSKSDKRQEYLRAQINAKGGLDLFGNQGSAVLSSCVWGDGLVENPVGSIIADGDFVSFIPFAELT